MTADAPACAARAELIGPDSVALRILSAETVQVGRGIAKDTHTHYQPTVVQRLRVADAPQWIGLVDTHSRGLNSGSSRAPNGLWMRSTASWACAWRGEAEGVLQRAKNKSVPFSAFEQVSDFGSNQTEVTVRVFQLSTNRGRGFPGEDTL